MQALDRCAGMTDRGSGRPGNAELAAMVECCIKAGPGQDHMTLDRLQDQARVNSLPDAWSLMLDEVDGAWAPHHIARTRTRKA